LVAQADTRLPPVKCPAAAAILMAMLVTAALVGCSVDVPTPRRQATATRTPVPTTVDNPVIGRAYPLRVSTHCGLVGVVIDGSAWDFDGMPGTHPPYGFTDPYDVGTVRLVDKNHAIYTSSQGNSFRLSRLRVGPSVHPCKEAS
jgi:hypothetical protein